VTRLFLDHYDFFNLSHNPLLNNLLRLFLPLEGLDLLVHLLLPGLIQLIYLFILHDDQLL
jgi:hypothetical protein